jgi:DNA-directed RNA polymerase specialized sigma24 family protein
VSDEAVKELNSIKKLLAVIATRGEARREQVLILTDAGFTPSEVADFLEIKPNAVSVIIYQAKKSSEKK